MRNRRIKSVRTELVCKSREAMLAAVQVYNNPQITFKSETFITLAVISWTYLLHAYYKSQNIDYRYYQQKGKRKKFDKTKNGAYKHWELEKCLNDNKCPIDDATKTNLKYLIGLRHEIEHQMTGRIDEYLSAKLQACAINYNSYICELFGEKFSVAKDLYISIQFSALSAEQKVILLDNAKLNKNLNNYITEFENNLSDEISKDSRYAYRVLYVQHTANRKGQADKVIEFIKPDSDFAKGIEKEYVAIKETEKKKYVPGEIIKIIQDLGYPKFKMHQHTLLWKGNDAKNPNKNFGTKVSKTWYWYETWVEFVKEHCKKSGDRYK